MDKRLADKKVIVFDVGNVLLRFDVKELADVFFTSEQHTRLFAGMFESGLWALLDTGLIAEEELTRLMCEAAHTQDQKDYETVLHVLKEYTPVMRPLPPSTWLKELKSTGKKLYYLTNFAEKQFEATARSNPFFALFDGGVVSAQEHMVKPIPRIYTILCERYGFAPQDAIFLDDNPENIAAAKKLGFDVWQYRFDE